MAVSTGALVVFALITVALALFVTELLPPDMTAIAVLVSLVVLEPYTGVPAGEALAGFASPAVVTIIGMYVLSGAIEETGVVAWLGSRLAALGGVVAVVATGCLRPAEVYDAIRWNVVFLLAGVLPLGTALQGTGGAAVIGDVLAGVAGGVPPVVSLAMVYLLASLLAAAITPVATVVLLTPIGYQTNLMVYTPGGYRFTDYARVGGPLLALLTVVSTVGIALLYGL